MLQCGHLQRGKGHARCEPTREERKDWLVMATPVYKSVWKIVGVDDEGNLVVCAYFTPATGYVFLVFRGVSRSEFLSRTRADLLAENKEVKNEWKSLVESDRYTGGLLEYAEEVSSDFCGLDFFGNKAGSWAMDALDLWADLPKEEKTRLQFGSIRSVDNDLSFKFGEEFITFESAIEGEVSVKELKPIKHFTSEGKALWEEIKAYAGI